MSNFLTIEKLFFTKIIYFNFYSKIKNRFFLIFEKKAQMNNFYKKKYFFSERLLSPSTFWMIKESIGEVVKVIEALLRVTNVSRRFHM